MRFKKSPIIKIICGDQDQKCNSNPKNKENEKNIT